MMPWNINFGVKAKPVIKHTGLDQAIMDDLIMNDTSVGPSDATTNITEENTQTSGKIKT